MKNLRLNNQKITFDIDFEKEYDKLNERVVTKVEEYKKAKLFALLKDFSAPIIWLDSLIFVVISFAIMALTNLSATLSLVCSIVFLAIINGSVIILVINGRQKFLKGFSLVFCFKNNPDFTDRLYDFFNNFPISNYLETSVLTSVFHFQNDYEKLKELQNISVEEIYEITEGSATKRNCCADNCLVTDLIFKTAAIETQLIKTRVITNVQRLEKVGAETPIIQWDSNESETRCYGIIKYIVPYQSSKQ